MPTHHGVDQHGVDDALAGGYRANGPDELGPVTDPVLEEIGQPARPVTEQLARVGLLGMREEHYDACPWPRAAGLSSGANSRELYLSVSAVEKHITSIFAKLGLLEQASTHRRVATVLTFLTER